MNENPEPPIEFNSSSDPFRPDVLDNLRSVANEAMGEEPWEVTYDTGIRSIAFTGERNFRPFYNLCQAFKEFTGLGLLDFERQLREGQSYRRHAGMVWAWLTFRNDNLPDAGVTSGSTRDAKIIAFWDEDARFVAQFDPRQVLAMIAEIERLKNENDELTYEVMAHQVSDGYDSGYQHGSILAGQYKTEADRLRKAIADIEEEIANVDAYGDDLDPADILAIVERSKPLPEPEEHEYDTGDNQ